MRILKSVAPKESTVENKVVKWARDNGFLSRKLNGVGYRSWPDRMFISPSGVVLFIEFKRLGSTPTENQQHMMDTLRKHNQLINWFDSKEDAVFWLSMYL